MQVSLQQLTVPPGHYVRLHGIGWPAFEQILTELGQHRGQRLAYDQGELEIMSPLLEHEDDKEILGDLIKILLEEQNREFLSAGSSTFKNDQMQRGIEPDQCFYIRHEPQVRGKKCLEMGVEPPPDLAIEIDIHSHSQLPIYEALGVPELWRFDGERLHIYVLQQGGYHTLKESREFPGLAVVEAIPRYLRQSKIEGRTTAMRAFRRWARDGLAACGV